MVTILCVILGLGYGESYLQILDLQKFKYF